MPAVPFPISSAPGVRPQEGAGRLINCYAEKMETGARFPVIWRRTAGLKQILNTPDHVHLRGAIMAPSALIAVLDGRVYAVTQFGGLFSAVNLGELDGTDPITVAKNNASTPNIVCVTSAGCFNLFPDSAPTSFADSDLPQPNSVTELNGYLLWTLGNGRIVASGLNNVSVATNSFTTEQSLGGLLRGVPFRGEFFAFGRKGIGVYRDIGALPFPLERHPFTIARGIAGTHAVAGWEEGWANDLIWVAETGVVCRMNGYTPEIVSSEDVSRIIAKAIRDGQGSALEASVYMQGKHAIWRLTNPGVWTWEYNATTQNWHERQSYGRDDCRASRSIWAFDRWIMGDRTTGLLFESDPHYYREANDPLRMILRSGPGAAFPSRIAVPRLDLDITAAVGTSSGEDPMQTDPSCLIRWSTDGGHSFGNPVSRKIGAEGQSDITVSVIPLGLTGPKGLVVEVEIADPVHAAVMGGTFAGLPRAE